MKKLIFSLAVLTAAIGANAQSGSSSNTDQKLKFSVGLELAAPMGDFKKTNNFGFGFSAQGDYQIDPTLALTLNAGYINFSGKDYSIVVPGVGTFPVKGSNFGLIPFLGGIKYNFNPQFYGSAQLGASFSAQSGGGGGSIFTYAPGIGYKFTENFDALLKYTGYSSKGVGNTLSTFGLRIAYTF